MRLLRLGLGISGHETELNMYGFGASTGTWFPFRWVGFHFPNEVYCAYSYSFIPVDCLMDVLRLALTLHHILRFRRNPASPFLSIPMTNQPHPSFAQSLIVCPITSFNKLQLTRKRIGWRSSGNVGRLVVFPNRYPQDSSPVRTRIHQGWWIQRRVSRCGQRCSGQRSWW
jgi:hypothetical protein